MTPTIDCGLQLRVLVLTACVAAVHGTFNFLIHGDWGWVSSNQTLVAQQMGVFGSQIDAKFVVALGDNFYESGVHNTTDATWSKAFHDVYTAASLQVPWYPILGNHDYRDNVQAQIDRTYEKGETLWNFPALYYVKQYRLSDGGIMSILYIDTQLLDPNHDDTQVIFENPDWEQARQDELDWIDRTLAEESKVARWLIVAGHYPIYSVGVNCDNKILAANLMPLLQKYNVHMYLAGHDHNHQYISMKDGIRYVVSGQSAGRGPFGPEGYKFMGISNSSDYIQNYFSECGFAYAEVDSYNFKTTFVNSHGEVKFTGLMANPFPNALSSSGKDENQLDSTLPTSGSSQISVGTAIILPTVLGTIILFLIVHRNSGPVQSAIQWIRGTRDSNVKLSIDDSVRSSHGLTNDLDTSIQDRTRSRV